MAQIEQETLNEIVLSEDQVICALTNNPVKATEKELNLQSMILMMTEEYNFALEDMERNFSFKYVDDEDKKKTGKVDLAIFEKGKGHDIINMIRFVIVAKDINVKPGTKKTGALDTMTPILTFTDCDFGLWTNGEDLQYMHCVTDALGQITVEDLSDFPSEGQTLEDLVKAGERGITRKPANESLVRTFKRCHDYIYGNEGMKKTAFWELLNLIFTKLYDEKRRFLAPKNGESYRRKFWVGVKELNSPSGQAAVAQRIKDLFEELKASKMFKDVFDGNEKIMLSDRGLAFVASKLAKYSFLDATVDVKGTAYETIVSNTLKRESGQFFTPRNIIKCMVKMLDPDQHTRILDPACGSGGFLVMALDYVRRKITRSVYPDVDDLHLEEKANTPEINDLVREYAENYIFGFDFDPDLKKAARMNMVMAGDGHANIFNINSLDYPQGSKPDVPLVGAKVKQSIEVGYDKDFAFDKNYAHDNAFGKFDMIFTNPPFGSNVEVDAEISNRFILPGNAPEVLFIEQCYNFLKPGGKMAIVLPDGILGNPNQVETRKWILKHFKLLASIDLPVEAFLPQVGVQASLLFLQKKTSQEQLMPYEKDDYDVFMAIVEKVGKDRRGVPIYKKDDDGAELLFEHIKKWISYNENNKEIIRQRKERIKRIDDDLPEVSDAYNKFKEEQGL